ncbi:MAG: MBL fold metallo-hydrolase [Firmicutes bacterium]|nr:MBL fold metallo-hydrolase [Bacillota bacterium]
MKRFLYSHGRICLVIVLLLTLLPGCFVPAPAPPGASPGPGAAEKPPSSPAPPPSTPAEPARPALSVHVIDVGQGDGILVKLPDGRTMLVDAAEPGKGKVVVAYLKAEGVSKIDYLVATHPHSDHIGGMAEVVRAFAVGDVYMPKTGHTSAHYEEFLRELKKRDLKVNEARKGVRVLDTGGLSISFIAPSGKNYAELNDWSAVARIEYGDAIILLTGDAGARSEQEMLLASEVSPRADVLKVGHHGSGTSSSAGFLKAVSPSYAIISVGAGNAFGHPSERTLARLHAAGARVYRTDLHGTVVVETDGKAISVRHARKGD